MIKLVHFRPFKKDVTKWAWRTTFWIQKLGIYSWSIKKKTGTYCRVYKHINEERWGWWWWICITESHGFNLPNWWRPPSHHEIHLTGVGHLTFNLLLKWWITLFVSAICRNSKRKKINHTYPNDLFFFVVNIVNEDHLVYKIFKSSYTPRSFLIKLYTKKLNPIYVCVHLYN